MTTATISLTGQQTEAATKIRTWWADKNNRKQVFRLFGYAGTGKTSLARHLVDQLNIRDCLYGAFTGKAAYVLRTKGCTGATTIHSLIYLPAEKAREKLRDLTGRLDVETDPAKRDILHRQIQVELRRLETPSWILREPEETDLATADLLVVDEVSMVGDTMAADLLSFNVPLLVLGDPAQLPPVDGAGYFINDEPDHLLTEIHRSALDSPVTRLATAVRSSTPHDEAYGIPRPDGESGRVDHITVAELLSFDQVLVGTNATRWQAIALLRALRGHVGDMPVPGDRVMALANSGAAEVFNGQQFDVVSSTVDPKEDDRVTMRVRDDEGQERDLVAWRTGFTGLEGEKQAKRDGRGSVAAATFAQAITTHKGQGSQWNRVLVIDEAHVFAGIEGRNVARLRHSTGLPDHGHSLEAGHVAGRRWLYTAVTRAARQVTIIPRLTGVLT